MNSISYLQRYFSLSISLYTPLSHRPTPGQNFAWGRVPNIALCVGILCGAFFVWGAQFSNVNFAWINNFRVKIYKNCVGIAWAWGFWWIVNKSPFVGIKKNQHFAWGIRGDVPTHPHTTFFCVGMRGEMCGVDMRGWVRQGCVNKSCHDDEV